MNTTLAPRKLPRQSRSQATVTAILDATARVLVERGYAATTTNAVAELAGVSVGSLYQYFPHKDALIAALHERHANQMLEVIEKELARHAESSLEDAITAVIHSIVEAHRVDADLHLILETQVPGIDHDHSELQDHFAEQLRALLARHQDRLRTPDLRVATFMLMHALHGLVHASVRERPTGVSLKTLSREMVHMTLSYLTVPR